MNSRQALAKARALGLPESDMANERLLLGGQSGDLRPLLDGLENIAGGTEQFDPQEVYEAATSGFLMTGRFADAANFIDKWKKDFPDDPNQKFFEAVLLIQIGPIQNIPRRCWQSDRIADRGCRGIPKSFSSTDDAWRFALQSK